MNEAIKQPVGHVREKTFYAQTSQGEIFMPLTFKIKVLRKVASLPDMQGFIYLVDTITPEQAEKVDELETDEFMPLIEEYFEHFNKQNRGTPGE